MESLKRKYLEKELKHIKYYNEMSPFPIFDTEYVKAVENELESMKNNKYDDLPVEACNSCGSLHIESDEMELNNICMRCGSINDLVDYPNIFEYMESKKGKFWNS